MRHKKFTKKQVKSKIKSFLKIWKDEKLDGEKFPLTSIIGNYNNNSMNRFIKETLFYNLGDGTRNGATWYLKYPKKSPKKLAKKVMKAINITS
jgi:hypothetical protein